MRATGINTDENEESESDSGFVSLCRVINQVLPAALVGFDNSSNAEIENDTGSPLVASVEPVTELRDAHAVAG